MKYSKIQILVGLAGVVVGLAVGVSAILWLDYMMKPQGQKAQQINCVNNLKQIGLSFRMWAGDNGDEYPFNVSTKQAGTLELCDRDKDGFDRNSWLHLLAMSNEFNTPKVLVCPQDKSKRPAMDWKSLQPANVTYLVRSGKDLNEMNPTNVLAVCPIDGNTVYGDGHVVEGKSNKKGWW
jgi:hypothetical protein